MDDKRQLVKAIDEETGRHPDTVLIEVRPAGRRYGAFVMNVNDLAGGEFIGGGSWSQSASEVDIYLKDNDPTPPKEKKPAK